MGKVGPTDILIPCHVDGMSYISKPLTFIDKYIKQTEVCYYLLSFELFSKHPMTSQICFTSIVSCILVHSAAKFQCHIQAEPSIIQADLLYHALSLNQLLYYFVGPTFLAIVLSLVI